MASLLYSQAEFQAAVDALKSYVSQLEGVLDMECALCDYCVRHGEELVLL